ncbi:MAG: 30S ribosomal protein S18 [Spirochaetia bacterium]|nr:30S ribosomal protein S18 [Spirochaetia bacterium]
MSEQEALEGKDLRDRAEGEHGGDHEGGDSYLDRKKHQKARYKKRVLDTRNLTIDYKDPETLERFVSKTGKILPRRMTGATARIQRKISREIRASRMIGLLAFSKR